VNGTVEDIGHVSGILPLVASDGYLHQPNTIGSKSCAEHVGFTPRRIVPFACPKWTETIDIERNQTTRKPTVIREAAVGPST
jgi:hypothetical protein